MRLALAAVLAAACVAPIHPEAPFRMEPRPTSGEVRVMPVLELGAAPALRLDGYVRDPVPWVRESIRRQRTEELSLVPDAMAVALPGAIATSLDGAWTPRFVAGRYPAGGRERVAACLDRRGDPDEALEDLARSLPSDAVLVSWVRELSGIPVTTEAFPGEIVETAAGPVVVDTRDEPFRVHARAGLALVSRDGEIVLRYEDDFESVLSSSRPPSRAGRDLAAALADSVASSWPIDPRLLEGEPLLVRR